VGCATKEDLNRFYFALDQKVDEGDKNLSNLEKDFDWLRSEVKELQGTVAGNKESNNALRKNQAGFGEDVNKVRSEIRNLRGVVEELKKELTTLSDGQKGEIRPEELNKTLADIAARLDYLEKYLEVEKEELLQEDSEGSKISSSEKMNKEKAYSEACKTFKSGEYNKARKEFEEFLKTFSDTEYSDNAQFWIGECYYFEGKYETAILEYEKVIKQYPKGNKVPNALLKQAFSFLKIEDKSSAELLLQRVMKDYPGTTPARIARQRLVDIK
jgi:tol-pal system protein YbgF